MELVSTFGGSAAEVALLHRQADLGKLSAHLCGRGPEAGCLGATDQCGEASWIPEPAMFPRDIAMDAPMALLKGDLRLEQARQKVFDYVRREQAVLGPFLFAGIPAKS